eukprot:c16820_g1_i1 orf=18-953(-)
MEEVTSSQWSLLSLVFAKLDGEALARTSCVSKGWRDVGSQEELWEALCLESWPSLSSPQGKTLLIQQGGSFKKFYRLRAQAQSQHRNGFPDRAKLPSLPLKDLFFLLDISHHGLPVASSIMSGDHLCPSFVGDGVHDSSFDFSMPISVSMLRAWSKEEIQELEVSWAITARGSQRIFQLLKTTNDKNGGKSRGVVVGNVCSYTQPIPSLSTSCITSLCWGSTKPYNIVSNDNIIMAPPSHLGVEASLQVQVKLECTSTRYPTTSPSGCIFAYTNFHPLKASFAILSTKSWSCLSQAQILMYLQHALFHQCA